MGFNSGFKGLNAKLNPICHLPALLGTHPILHISRIRVKKTLNFTCTCAVVMSKLGKLYFISFLLPVYGNTMISKKPHLTCSLLTHKSVNFFMKSIHSFSSLSYDRSKASSKASSPHSAIQSFLFHMRVFSPFLKVIQ